MAYDDLSSNIPAKHDIPHYHGDATRALFVVGAVLIVVGLFMNGASALGSVGAIAVAIVLVVAAGVTNPAQLWIHWVNALLAGAGALFFGSTAFGSYRAGGVADDPVLLVFTLALSVLSLVALYLSTRTIRGMMLREPR